MKPSVDVCEEVMGWRRMMDTSSCAGRNPITFEVFDGYGHVGDFESRSLVGHSLTRRRQRYLQGAECIVVTEDSRLLGVAAYQRVKSDVRLVREFLVHRDLGERQAAIVTDRLASAVEAMALSDSVHCLMFMLWPDVTREPFERRGYRAVVLDPYLGWLQKTLDQGSCIHVCSQHLH
jgi:hypothetical protein